MEQYLFLIVLIFLLFFQTPVPVAVLTSSIIGMAMNGLEISATAFATVNSLNSFTMLAVPFFILAGNLMCGGSIARDLLKVAQAFAGGKRESIGTATIIACAFFAAISGSAVVTLAALGSITIPMMVKQGYKPAYACAVAASGAVVGPIIPPSISMVMYGVTTKTSISDLFMAGAIPGILISVSFYIALRLTAKNNIDYDMPVEGLRPYSFIEKMRALWEGKWAILMPVIVLGGIYGGIFTPTEAAVVACDYAIIVGLFILKDLKLKDVFAAVRASLGSLGALMILMGVSNAFGQVLTLNLIPQKFAGAVLGISTNPVIVLLLVTLIGLIVGCFMEGITAIVILTPILLPLVQECGLNSLQFGILICTNMAFGCLTPPFGLNLYVSSNIGNVPVLSVSRKALPFLAAGVIMMIIMTFVPEIISFLPTVMAK